MGEAKKRRDEYEARFGKNPLWRVTEGAKEYLDRAKMEEMRVEEIISGLKRCSVCGGEAVGTIFGLMGRGVWIGCDRSEECSRYIEMHPEGWSLEECAAEWNKWNGGWRRAIRIIKRKVREVIGREARAWRRIKREKMAKEAEDKAKRRETFGIEAPRGRISRLIGFIKSKANPFKGKKKEE